MKLPFLAGAGGTNGRSASPLSPLPSPQLPPSIVGLFSSGSSQVENLFPSLPPSLPPSSSAPTQLSNLQVQSGSLQCALPLPLPPPTLALLNAQVGRRRRLCALFAAAVVVLGRTDGGRRRTRARLLVPHRRHRAARAPQLRRPAGRPVGRPSPPRPSVRRRGASLSPPLLSHFLLAQ